MTYTYIPHNTTRPPSDHEIHSEWYAKEYDPRIENRDMSFRSFMKGKSHGVDEKFSNYFASFLGGIVFSALFWFGLSVYLNKPALFK